MVTCRSFHLGVTKEHERGIDVTGWNLPPGCTYADLEAAMGTENPCEVCGRWSDDCICPECPKCGQYGDPQCYRKHGLSMSAIQIASKLECEEAMREENRRADEAFYRGYLDYNFYGCLYDDDGHGEATGWSDAIGWASR